MCEICAMTATFDPARHPGLGPLEANVIEGSDAPGAINTPYSIAVGDTFEGSLTAGSDTTDVIAVTLTAGTTYEIAHTGSTGGGGTLSDPYLRLLDGSGSQVAVNDDGGLGFDSLLTFTATSTGTYYIEAGSYASSGTGTYTVSVNTPEPVGPGTVDELADFLTHGYWGGFSRSWDTSADNTITVNITALTADGQQLARWAFEAWEMVADIRFVETTGSADMTFDDNQSGAFASSSSGGGTIFSSNVNVSTSWVNNYGSTIDSYSFQTYIHEIGHALGLGHQGDYNGNASYGTDAAFTNDSWQMSVMSYFSQSQNTSISASYAFTLGPMMADIVAIQNLYGAPSAGAAIDTTGNTTWGANSNLGGYLGAYFDTLDGPNNPDLVGNRNVTFTIYDHSGTDTLDTTFTNSNNVIDMRDQQFSNVDGLTGNIGIARGTILENVIAGNGNDTITGNEADNRITAGEGNDNIIGNGGTDTIVINANRADAVVTDLGNGQVEIVSIDGTDTVEGVEFFEFNDQTLSLNDLFGVTTQPDFALASDVPETGYYGNRFMGSTNTDGVIRASFTGTTEDLSLSVTGFDVDFVGEVEVFLNGTSLGYLEATPDNGTGTSRFDIAASDQVAGENTIEFHQVYDPNFSWGVTDVVIAPPGADFILAMDDPETGYYGNRFMGSTDGNGVVQATFEGTTEDLALSVTGFDVDFVGEVEVFLNGTSLGYLETTPDNGTGTSRFDIAAGDQLAGENTIEFHQVSDPNFSWGVTDILIAPPEPDFILALGDPETGHYGNRFMGSTDSDGRIQAVFTGTASDLSLSVTGFDVDFVGEVEVFLNGTSLGYLEATPDNGTGTSRFDIAAGDQVAGENTIEFHQVSDPNFSWGVTDVLIDEFVFA